MTSQWRHSWPVSAVRFAAMGLLFFIGCPSLIYTQFVGIFFFQKLFKMPGYLQATISLTKTHFVVLLTFISQVVSPCTVKVTFDPKKVGENAFTVGSSNRLRSQLRPNSVLVSNHQIYTDWLYLWYLTYTSRLSDAVYIVLKDLSKLPILGAGMRNYNFLFLSRKWANDKPVLTRQLGEIDANARGVGPANGVTPIVSTSTFPKWPAQSTSQVWPYELIIFPEGTVMSNRTVNKSRVFCEEQGRPQVTHVLLPRVRGLFLALRKLRNSVELVYDITTGYSDLLPTELGEDKFSLKRFYIRGYGPPRINYYVDAWKISDIPLGRETEDVDDADPEDLKAFDKWLSGVWYEKDKRMKKFYEEGGFVPKDGEKSVEAPFGLYSVIEIVQPFLVMLTTVLLLRIVLKFLWRLIRG
ncbi:2-acyl-1-lysophosphatidylinositol acyltransferase [Diutina catenulata]